MSNSKCWDLWGTQRKWEDPLLRVISSPHDEFTAACFDLWLNALKIRDRADAPFKTLNLILSSITHFGRNIDDSVKALRDDHGRRNGIGSALNPKWQDRLRPLLRCVIQQHLRLFQPFRNWAKERSMIEEQPAKVRKTLANIAAAKTRIETQFHDPIFQICSQKNKDIKYQELERDIQFLKEKRICRSVIKVTLLILRCHENDKMQMQSNDESRYSPRIEQERQSLEQFLDTLKTSKSCIRGERKGEWLPPCVTRVVCFDETSQAIGVTVPTWPWKYNPWISKDSRDFFTISRDSRISFEIHEHHFKPAVRIFDKLVFEKFGEIVQSDYMKERFFAATASAVERRAEFCTAFGEAYFGPFRRYEQHAWQAIRRWDFQCRDQRPRCQFYWYAALVQPNNTQVLSTAKSKLPHDFKSFERIDACVESCLHAEQAKNLG